MPSQTHERFAPPWTMDGPLPTGVILIRDAAGYCVATVKVDPACPIQCHVIAGLLSRTPNRHAVLEHVLTELQGDDEGARHPDLLAMIERELKAVVAFQWPDSNGEPATPAPTRSAEDLVEGFKRLADQVK
jgi:hypothetical protein